MACRGSWVNIAAGALIYCIDGGVQCDRNTKYQDDVIPMYYCILTNVILPGPRACNSLEIL